MENNHQELLLSTFQNALSYKSFVPYGQNGKRFDSETEFGFACNLQYKYTGGEWHAWQGKNPTGFNGGVDKGGSSFGGHPHFEHLVSYIRFDENLNIITY